jgi:dephospho-CoA kinase
MRRVTLQRGWSPEEYALRERAQLPLTEKARRAHVALDNSGSVNDLEPAIDRLLAELGIEASAPTAESRPGGRDHG